MLTVARTTTPDRQARGSRPVGLPPRAAPHAVVIGSGFGGLAAAVRLGARGYRVTVLEKLDAPGGRASVHREAGFTFDFGPTIITAPFLLEELWALCGKRFEDDIDLRSLEPFYRMHFHDGDVFEYSGEADRMREEISRFNPDDIVGFERFLQVSERNYRIGFEQLGHVPFPSWKDMARVVPKLMRMGAYRTVHSSVAKYIKDPRLRMVFSFHSLLIGGNPFSVTSIYTLIAFLERRYGVHFPMGGTNRLVAGMAGLIEGQGNTIRCNAEVSEITVKNGRATGVRLASGDTIPADIVVSNADAAWTYRHLLPAEARRRWSDRRLARTRYSMSLFVWYFGVKRRYEDVRHHTILLGPRYKELLADIFGRHKLAQDFSLYLHRPTATDPSLAPEGCDTFYALSPVPHLDSEVDWDQAAEPYRRAISQYLSDTILPGLEDELVVSRLTTPLTFRDRLLSYKGAAFGPEPLMTQSAWFRPHNKSEDIERLYIVGAGTHPGAGIPGVLTSARILDTVVPDVAALS